MKTVSVKLPAPLAEWLAQHALESRPSKLAVVRQVLEQQRRKPGEHNCLALMQDVSGNVRGPRDLATNPRHLKGLGR